MKSLWVSPFALQDKSNGAAIRCKLTLEMLAERGHDVKAMTMDLEDAPKGLANTEVEKHEQDRFQFFEENGVQYFVLNVRNTHQGWLPIGRVNLDKFSEFMVLHGEMLQKFDPDVVIGFGADVVSCALRHEAKVRGYPTVYMLRNGLHEEFAFSDCDAVLTNSQATAERTLKMNGVKAQAIGNVFDPKACIAKTHHRRYVVMGSAYQHKGVALYIKLARMCPELQFCLVQSRDSEPELWKLKENGEKVKQLPANLRIIPFQPDVRALFAQASVLVVPSVWFESWGGIASEAIMNGIPVLASDSGGLPEVVGQAGVTLSLPQSMIEHPDTVPEEKDVQPWVDALHQILEQDWTESCQQQAQEFNSGKCISKLQDILQTLAKTKNKTGKKWYWCTRDGEDVNRLDV